MNILLAKDLRSLQKIRRTQNRFISSLSIANKKGRDKSRPFLFTRDAIRTHDLPLRSCITQCYRGFSGFIRIYLYLLQRMNLKQILFSNLITIIFDLSEFLQLICNSNAIKERLKFEKMRFYTKAGEG